MGVEAMEKAQLWGHRSWTGPLNGAEGTMLMQMKAKQNTLFKLKMHARNSYWLQEHLKLLNGSR